MPTFAIANAGVNFTVAAWAAYRAFVRCYFEPERLLWLDFSHMHASQSPWLSLMKFAGVSASFPAPGGGPIAKTEFPHWGTDRCAWGELDCCAGLKAGCPAKRGSMPDATCTDTPMDSTQKSLL